MIRRSLGPRAEGLGLYMSLTLCSCLPHMKQSNGYTTQNVTIRRLLDPKNMHQWRQFLCVKKNGLKKQHVMCVSNNSEHFLVFVDIKTDNNLHCCKFSLHVH